jgi:hypothetical protein
MSTAGAPIPDFQLPYTAYAFGGQNGRVNLSAPSSAGGSSVPDSAGFSFPQKTEKVFSGDMLRGNWEHTALSEAFFTQKNATYLQQKVKSEVYRRSGPKKYVIDDQDVDELKMIMRAIYLQYAKNNPFNIEGQVAELNDIIIEWCAPRILSEVDHYNYYLNDISKLPVPLTQPMNMSSAGTRSLPLQPYM